MRRQTQNSRLSKKSISELTEIAANLELTQEDIELPNLKDSWITAIVRAELVSKIINRKPYTYKESK